MQMTRRARTRAVWAWLGIDSGEAGLGKCVADEAAVSDDVYPLINFLRWRLLIVGHTSRALDMKQVS